MAFTKSREVYAPVARRCTEPLVTMGAYLADGKAHKSQEHSVSHHACTDQPTRLGSNRWQAASSQSTKAQMTTKASCNLSSIDTGDRRSQRE